MARKSKSSKDSTNTEASEKPDDEVEESQSSDISESSDAEPPVIIEAEAKTSQAGEDDGSDSDGDDAGPNSDEEPAAEPVEEGAATSHPDESPVPSEVAVVAPPPEPTRASPVPLLIGGLIAGGLGYLVATVAQPGADISSLDEEISANSAQIEAISSEIATLQETPAPVVDLSGIEASLAGFTDKLDGFAGELTSVRDDFAGSVEQLTQTSEALSDRLTVLETAGPGDTEAARATEQDLAAFRAELDRMTAEAESRVAASLERASEIEAAALATASEAEAAAAEAERLAAEAAAQAETEAAIAAMKAALESGQSYADQLATLGDVPEVLETNAETGVTTLVELQQSYPGAARAALSEAESIPQDASAGERFTAFLKQRTNARSLTPKEGDSADAILSRAEAMVKQGDLLAALAELDALGEGPAAAMQNWLEQARTRAAALDAAEQLTATN